MSGVFVVYGTLMAFVVGKMKLIEKMLRFYGVCSLLYFVL